MNLTKTISSWSIQFRYSLNVYLFYFKSHELTNLYSCEVKWWSSLNFNWVKLKSLLFNQNLNPVKLLLKRCQFTLGLVWKWQSESKWQKQVLNKDSVMAPPLCFSCFKCLYNTSSLQRTLSFHKSFCICLTHSLSACFLPQKRERRRRRDPPSHHCFISLKIYVISTQEWDTVQFAFEEQEGWRAKFSECQRLCCCF